MADHRCFVALGTNLGERYGYVKRAIARFNSEGLHVVSTGFLYESEPMYYEDQPAFLNTCVEIITSLGPKDLFNLLKTIETDFGRTKTARNGPRCIDLDIIFYDDLVIQEPDLIIPHPKLDERGFVLAPLRDMCPKLVHPVLNRTVDELYSQLLLSKSTSMTKVLPIDDQLVYPIGPNQFIFGVLNVTPDSFSDGGKYFSIGPAMAHANKLTNDGANVIDVGGESTRPNATVIDAVEEQNRVIELISNLKQTLPREVSVSIDTYKASTARAAIQAGAKIVNDVSAGMVDPDMLPVVAELAVPYVCMHSGKVGSHLITHDYGPSIIDDSISPEDALLYVHQQLEARVKACLKAGICRWNIILDPGLGFGKSGRVNFDIVRNLKKIFSGTLAGYPVMIGASRKRFVRDLESGGTAWSGTEEEAMLGTAAVTVSCVSSGIPNFHRVHDVAQIRRVLDVCDRIYRE